MTLVTDICVRKVKLSFTSQPFRAPLKFGSAVIESLTLLTATVEAENGRGEKASGTSNVLLSFPWAYPGGESSPEAKDGAMHRVAETYARLVEDHHQRCHPVELFTSTQDDLFSMALAVDPEMPRLAALVAASPIDSAAHDAFGRVNRICSYDGFGPAWCEHDLSPYLGEKYRGRFLADFLRERYAPSLPVFHLVGGLDAIDRNEVPADGSSEDLPRCLEEWIEREGIYCFKLKLRGNDLAWDLERCKRVAEVARRNRSSMGSDRFCFSIDTNECCDGPEYCIELLAQLSSDDAEAYESILYFEQPTGRDLDRHDHDMRELAALKPVLVDESASTLSDFERSIELGWSGIALKTCKCLSLALLETAKAKNEGLCYSVQDLTNCGSGLVQSVAFAARIDPIMGVECNSRQYIPSANRDIRGRHRDIVDAKSGRLGTDSLDRFGLGCRAVDK